jgi:hypothetical protein
MRCQWRGCSRASASVVAIATSSFAAEGRTVATAAPAATPTTVATMRGSSRRGSRAIECWFVFATDAVASAIYCGATATSGFVVCSGSDSIINPHVVGVVSKLGDDFACVVP